MVKNIHTLRLCSKKFAGGGILTDQGIHMLDLLNLFVFTEYKSFN